MHFTIFKRPLLVLWFDGFQFGLKLIGGGGQALEVPAKVRFSGAPHTSNWDFPIALMICFALRLTCIGWEKYFVSAGIWNLDEMVGGFRLTVPRPEI